MREEPESIDGAYADWRRGPHAPWREVELRRLTADIAARLQKVCAHMPEDEFATLVADMARLRMRFDGSDVRDD